MNAVVAAGTKPDLAESGFAFRICASVNNGVCGPRFFVFPTQGDRCPGRMRHLEVAWRCGGGRGQLFDQAVAQQDVLLFGFPGVAFGFGHLGAGGEGAAGIVCETSARPVPGAFAQRRVVRRDHALGYRVQTGAGP